MLVVRLVACSAPTVSSILYSPAISQGYSRFISIRLNSSTSDDVSELAVDSQPNKGVLDTSLLRTQSVVLYRLGDDSQYYYGNDTFHYRAHQTGLTVDGELSPCLPLSSLPGVVTVPILNVNDAPELLLDVFSQPSPYLLNRYGNNSASRFIFDIDLLEGQNFSILLMLQVS